MAINRPHFGVFTRTNTTGVPQSRMADTPADAVQFAFDGWEQTTEPTATQEHAEALAAGVSPADLVFEAKPAEAKPAEAKPAEAKPATSQDHAFSTPAGEGAGDPAADKAKPRTK